MNSLINVNTTQQMTAPQINGDLFRSWVDYIDAAPKTIETYGKAIKQFLVFLQDRGITAPTREDIISYRESLRQSHKPTTTQNYLMAVKQFFNWTEAEGIYPNIAKHIKGAKIDREQHKKDYLTSSQAYRLLSSIERDTLQGKRDYAIISLMITTGLRTISVIRADIKDIRPVGDDMALYYQGKGHEEKADLVKLAPQVEEAINDYLTARGVSDPDAPLFTSLSNHGQGERLTTRSVSRIAKQHFIDIGINSERVTAHSLRHTAGTLNLMNGGSLEETQQLLGHKDINTTMIYVHALDRAANNSEYRIASAIFK